MAATGGTAPYTFTATGLPGGLSITTAGLISGKATAAATSTVKIVAKDAVGTSSAALSFTWTTGTAPVVAVLAAPGTRANTLNTAVSGISHSASGGTTPYVWSATGLPTGLSINTSTGAVTGTPTAAGTYAVRVIAASAAKIPSAPLTYSWNVATALTVTTPATQQATIGQSSSLTVNPLGGTAPYAWSATGLPTGLSINDKTGVVSGTPTTGGTSATKVTITDAFGRTVTASFSWVVAAAPAVIPPVAQTSTVGVAITSLTVSATGGTTPYTWSATGLPAGLSIASGSGVVSGTPTTAGTSSVTVSAKDSTGRTSAGTTFAWTVGTAVAITAVGTQQATTGKPVTLALTANGGTTSYTWTATGLPAGLTINATTGVITGTPTTVGTASVTVTAKDTAGRTSTATFSWVVAAAPTVITPANRSSTTGVAIASVTLSATGGTTPYTWTATGLPAGLTLNTKTGVITGTPTTAGVSTVTVSVGDATGRTSAGVTFTWRTATPVVLTDPNWPGLSTGIEELNTVGDTVALAMKASGGNGPFAWSATGLPAGLSIAAGSGLISGSPTDAGADEMLYSDTVVTAVDADGRIGTLAISWGVRHVLSVIADQSDGSTVTAWVNRDVSPAVVRIYDRTADNLLLKTCPGNVFSCQGIIDYKATGAHIMYARVESADGKQVSAISNDAVDNLPTTFNSTTRITDASVFYTSFDAVDQARLVVSTSAPINASPYNLTIVDQTTGAVVATCGGGTSCSATVGRSYEGHSFGASFSNRAASFLSGQGLSLAPWALSLTRTLSGLEARSNRDPGRYLVLYDYTTNQFLSRTECGETYCAWDRALDSTHVYQAVGVSADNLCPTSCTADQILVTSDGVSGAAVSPPPLEFTETTGGQNPAEAQTQSCVCDPVNTATGEFFDSLTDLTVAGKGPALSAQRTYSSAAAGVDGPLGYGWSFRYGAALDLGAPVAGSTLPATVRVRQENGSTVTFTADGAGGWKAPARVFATLSYEPASTTWTFTRRAGEIMTFDGTGRLSTVRDLNGNAVSLDYDEAGHLHTVQAAGGRSLTLTWAAGHIAGIGDSAGRAVTYAYDSAGNLTSVRRADGGMDRYGYDDQHRITSAAPAGEGAVTNIYDGQGRVVRQTDALGHPTTMSYSGSGAGGAYASTTTTITDSDGVITVYRFLGGYLSSRTNAAGTALQQKWSYSVDAAGNLTTITDPMNRTVSYAYDARGNRIRQTDPLRAVTTWTYDALNHVTASTDPLGRTTGYTYDAAGNLLTTTSPGGRMQRWTRNADGTAADYTDAAGAITTFTYDTAGRPVTVTAPGDQVTTTVYNPAGDPVSVTAAGEKTTTTFDAAGRPLTVTAPGGRTTDFQYDAAGRVLTVTDANHNTTTNAYDDLGRLVRVTGPDGAVTTQTYNAHGDITAVTDPVKRTTTTEYDVLGRQIRTTDADKHTTAYEYDADGRLTATTLPSGAVQRTEYDLAGQVLSTTNGSGNVTTYGLDSAGQPTSVTDPLGRTTTRTWTTDGQLDTVTAPDSGTTSYTYDANGRVLTVSNPDGYRTTYEYNLAGQQTRRTQPGGIITSYTYDAAGRPKTTVQPGGSIITNTYNTSGDLTGIDYSDPATPDVTYAYDAAGRRTTMTDGTGTTTYTYDAADRRTAATTAAGTVAYAYDSAGELTTLTYPGGQNVGYTYDAAGHMASATDWAGRVTTFGWNADGEQTTQVTPDGVTLKATLDAIGNVTALALTKGSTTLAAFGYTYDAAGQLTGTTKPSSKHTYTYTDGSQLASIKTTSGGGATGAYTTTPAGLLTGLPDGTAMAYNGAQQLATSTSPAKTQTTFQYDARGNRTSATVGTAVSTYEYDQANHLKAATPTAGTRITYSYDGTGLRRTRSSGGTTSSFVWDTADTMPLLLDDGTHRYLYGPGLTPYAQISPNGTIEYLHTDQQGSVTHITDATGTVAATNTYDPYGNRTAHTGTAQSAIGYTGAWTDPSTGLLYLRARDYDPATGQFTTIDPAADSTHQPYAYVSNNPLQDTDPSGLCDGCSFWDSLKEHATSFEYGLANELLFGLPLKFMEMAAPGSTCFIKRDGWFNAGGASGNLAGMAIPVGGELNLARDAVGGAKLLIAAAKRGPKAFLTGPHNQTIKKIADGITDGEVVGGGQQLDKFGKRLPEAVINTPGGLKNSRRPDILVKRPDGTRYGINVGRQEKRTGLPVKRERGAINDLEHYGDLPMHFVPYN